MKFQVNQNSQTTRTIMQWRMMKGEFVGSGPFLSLNLAGAPNPAGYTTSILRHIAGWFGLTVDVLIWRKMYLLVVL
jgi:hypothetical protein